ncbi:hypothetical protein NIES267_66680 [Calothrix parasitica NIES-267]|uniref:Uncharacterized protein n=1 Tax=Calothrix parasitica NIES-267 TaxID=1973488 RepID=A0A1Z4M101_9CYAN|nr:hypothetical protein NIES267_66680 [Calothrix parasitica NIES-267]
MEASYDLEVNINQSDSVGNFFNNILGSFSLSLNPFFIVIIYYSQFTEAFVKLASINTESAF